MTGHPYITFAKLGKPRTETFHVPADTEAQRYARTLAPAIYREKYRYQAANYRDDDLVVLIPQQDIPDRDIDAIDGGSIIGIPMRLVAGIKAPMLAVELERHDLP